MAAQILVRDAWVPDPVRRALKTYSPKSELGKIVRECLKYLPADLAADLVDRITSCVVVESSLAVVVFRHPDSLYRAGRGLVEDYGIVSRKVVTTAGVGFIVDAAQNLTELENMKYHGLGTNNTAESASDTTLNTELTTAYNPDNTRATGTTTEGASANIYKTVGTNTVDGSASVVEHGIFSQAATGGGVLLDRSVFSTVSLSSGDALQSSYELTFNSGG
jgi:hypothetical protein